jgi:MFS superfamily sulfate permease-like transporter
LASVLILVGYKLSKAPLYKAMYKLGWNQFIPFLVTIFAILITDLLVGIGIGIAFSIFYILRTNYRIPYFFDENNTSNYIKIFLAQEVSFLNKAGIQLMLEKLPSNTKVEVDGSKSVYIDYDVLEILQEFEKVKSISKNIDFHLVNVKSKY